MTPVKRYMAANSSASNCLLHLTASALAEETKPPNSKAATHTSIIQYTVIWAKKI